MTTLTLELLLSHGEGFRKAISAHYPVPRRLIDAYPGQLDFELLSENQSLAWDEGLLDAHPNRWDWSALAKNPALPWSVALIKQHVPKRWTWADLMWQPRVFAEPALLALCLPSWRSGPRERSGSLEFADDGNYRYFRPFAPAAAAWAHDVVEAAKGVDWEHLSAVSDFPWTADFLSRHAHRLSWQRLSWNRGLPWSVELIRRFEERWDWSHMSPGLPWSEALIAAFAERWSWHSLALWVPWSEALLDRFGDRICWARATYQDGQLEGIDGVINHAGFRWTPALYQRHGAAVERHFEGLRAEVAAEGDDLGDEHWTYHCDTSNWSGEMLALAAAHEASHGVQAVCWESVCRSGQHFWSDDVVAAHRPRLVAEQWTLASNQHFPWHRYLADFAAGLGRSEWSSLSSNPGLILDRELVDRYPEHWHWPALSANPSLDGELIAAYAERWDWRALSRNPALDEATARRFAERLHGPSLTKLPWASLRTADPALPWDWFALVAREPDALRELLDDERVEAFLSQRAGHAAGPTREPPPPPPAPGGPPHPSTPAEMASRCDQLWTGHANRELVEYGQAVLAYFAERDDVPKRVAEKVRLLTGIGCANLGLPEGIPLLDAHIASTGDKFQHANIARIHLARGELELALAALDRGPATAFFALRVRGQVLEAAGRLDDAEAAYRASLASHSQKNPAADDLAALLERRKGG